MTTEFERVKFRLIHLQCCGHLLCWVNPRYPTYCPSCGKLVYPDVKGWVVKMDDDAVLELHIDI